jgi:hypothetical protein
MALHSKLPIYKIAYDMTSVAIDLVRNMPRDVKSTLGGQLKQLCFDIVLLVIRANCAIDKAPHLTVLIERNEELQIVLRLCQDKRFISRAQYAKAVELSTSVGKQANGWRKYAASPVT